MSEEAVLELSKWAFLVFAFVCWLMFISILLKTKWWRSSTGINVAILSGWFVFVVMLGIFGSMGILPELVRQWTRFVIYASGSIILFCRIKTLWIWNWHFWAWSKDERNKDGYTMDRYTFLRQLGYYGSLAEMEAKYAQNTTRLDTVGEKVYFALDETAARDALGITSTGGGPVSPSDLVPSLGNVDNTSDLNKPISTATQTALNLKANQTALDTTNSNLAAKANQTSLDTTNTNLTTTNTNVTNLTTTVGTKATDTLVVHLAGTETITGNKTATGTFTVQTPTVSGHAATKGYVDSVNSNTYALFPANAA